jgi:hypothetical protein
LLPVVASNRDKCDMRMRVGALAAPAKGRRSDDGSR